MPQEQTMFSQTEEEEGTNQSEQSNQADPENENSSSFDILVGEGKKFSDIESLAKGKLESDKHVVNLETQIKDLREELSKRETAKEIAEQLRNDSQPESAPTPVANTTPGLSAKEVADIVRTTMTNVESQRSTQDNVLAAQSAFKVVHGDKTQEVLASKAAELGMTTEQLGDIAGKSPTAFAKMVGLEERSMTRSGDQSPMGGDHNSEALNIHNANTGPKEGSHAYWSIKRKELGEKFWTPSIQQQVIKDKEDGRYDA